MISETISAPGSKRRPFAREGSDRITAPLLVLLLAAVAVVFGQTVFFEFVNFDDDRYVVSNPHLRQGFAPREIGWAFTNLDVGLWIPLVWLSFILDSLGYGTWAGGWHVTNVVVHAAVAAGLFLFLRMTTGCPWRSALAAAIFAIHPLRAESVAWVTERKDVLSGLGTVATLAAYAGYARRPSWPRYAAVAGCFGLALMAKPSVVPLPVALLALDVWPLGRTTGRHRVAWRRLLVEKLPLLVMSLSICAATLAGSSQAISEREDAARHLSIRCSEALVTYADLAARMLWPAQLAVRFESGPPAGWQVAAAAGAIVVASGAVWRWRRREPAVLTGWLWYAVMLLPVSGIVSQGAELRPDRFTYLPGIGLAIAVAWAAGAVCDPGRRGEARTSIVAVCWLAVLMLLAVACWRQVGFWRNSVTLWSRSVACDPHSHRAESLLGTALETAGSRDEALVHYLRSTEITPDYANAHYNIGVWMHRAGRLDEARAAYATALRLRPGFAHAHNNIGNVLIQSGRFDEAIPPCREAVRLDPQYAEAEFNLGTALLRTGSTAEAVQRLAAAVSLRPDQPTFQNRLAEAYLAIGRPQDAADSARQAIRQREIYPGAHLILGRALAAAGKIDAAAEQLRIAREQARTVGQPQVAAEAEARLEALEHGPPPGSSEKPR